MLRRRFSLAKGPSSFRTLLNGCKDIMSRARTHDDTPTRSPSQRRQRSRPRLLRRFFRGDYDAEAGPRPLSATKGRARSGISSRRCHPCYLSRPSAASSSRAVRSSRAWSIGRRGKAVACTVAKCTERLKQGGLAVVASACNVLDTDKLRDVRFLAEAAKRCVRLRYSVAGNRAVGSQLGLIYGSLSVSLNVTD